jgi:hypothetical protein
MTAKSLAKLVDEYAVLLQKLVRIKAADDTGYCRCCSCGGVYHWKSMDGGHFISRKYTATKVMEENIHAQCKRCNGFGDHFTYKNYQNFMIDMYGADFVEWLEIESKKTKKHDRLEIEGLIKETKELISKLERGL